MRLSDYRRLGKISIKARKKSTKHTVTGICFGLIMLIPIVYFTLAFYLGLTKELNKTATTAVFMLDSRNVYDSGAQITATDQWGEFYAFDYPTGQKLANDTQVEEYVAAEMYALPGGDSMDQRLNVTLDGEPYTYRDVSENNNGRETTLSLKVVNTYVQDRIFLDAELKDLSARGQKLFRYGDGFTDGGKTQAIVSESFLVKCGVSFDSIADVIGKKISLTAETSRQNGNIRIFDKDDSMDDSNGSSGRVSIPFLSDFTVVGVLSDNYYKLPGNENEAAVLVTAPSVYDESYGAIVPTFTLAVNDNSSTQAFARYTDGIAVMCDRAKSSGRMVLAYGALSPMRYQYGGPRKLNYYYMTESRQMMTPPIMYKLQCGSYQEASEFAKTLNAAFAAVLPSSADSPVGAVDYFANSMYSNFSMIHTIGKYIMLILYSFGGIIFFATMLNLYNSVNYSVQARRNYIGVMRAIGAKQKSIPRLYFFEILLIFARALPWVLVFSAGISYGIKAGVDALFKMMSEMFGAMFTMSFGWYFATLAGVFAIVFLIAVAFSQIACHSVASKPILDVLSDDKG